MTIADLFCGAGGMSDGAVAAAIRQDPDVRFLEDADTAKAA